MRLQAPKDQFEEMVSLVITISYKHAICFLEKVQKEVSACVHHAHNAKAHTKLYSIKFGHYRTHIVVQVLHYAQADIGQKMNDAFLPFFFLRVDYSAT